MFRTLLLLSTLALNVNTIAGQLAAQTDAVCSTEFNWAANSQRDTPCLVLAKVLGACHPGGWRVPKIDSKHWYTLPNSTTENSCMCSWAAYNLYSACTACQGFDSSIYTWPVYQDGCSAQYRSNTYVPANTVALTGLNATNSDRGFPFDRILLPRDTSIPFWASIKPSTWGDQRFNVAQAKKIHDQGHPDLTSDSHEPPKKSSTTGPIVGGVIGGLAAIGLALGVAYFMKSRKRKQHRQGGAIVDPYGPTHTRNKSDLSQSSGADMNLPYMRIQSPQSFATTQFSHPPMSPGSTMHTRNGSAHSLSYFGSISGSVGYGTSPPPPSQRQLSPPPPIHNAATHPQNIIEPFTLQPLTTTHGENSRQGSNANLTDRKRPDGAIVPVYSAPDAPPQAVIYDDPPIPSSSGSGRPKLNPPAYSPPAAQGQHGASSQSPARSRPPHTKQGSADTQHSWDSGRSGGTTRPGGGGSISAIDDVIGQMGYGADATVSGRDGTVATGQSGNLAGTQMGPMALVNPENITRHNLA